MLFMTGVERSYASAIELASRDLTVRSEVGSVMEGMLGDLEAWEWANKEEALKTELDHARAQVKALQESEKRLIEREALVAAKLEEDKTIAREVRGKFVQELWGLAKEFRLREQEQAKADQLSKKLTRLEGVEAELREAESKLAKLQLAYDAAVTVAAAAEATVRAAGGNAGERRASPQAVGSLGSIDSATGSAIVGGRRASAGATMGGRGSARAAPGSLLLGLEKKPLLKVFVFLNAGEVLRAAQVCRAMFKKVDRMFGIGSQADIADPAPAPAPDAGTVDRTVDRRGGHSGHNGGGGGGGRSRAESTASTSSTTALPSQQTAMLGQRALANALGVVVSRVEAVTAGASGGLGSLAGAAASLTGGGGAGVGTNSDAVSGGASAGGGMSPELLDSLSKRLTTAEMRGIIHLQERGRRLEERAGALQAEKEDLFARLQGTESVKEFLVTKLKDTETALKRSLDEKGLSLRQSASDQEVISFLDSRTQEMERVARETMDKAVTYQTELENAKLSGQRQTKVLEDMLRFEKQRGEAEEAAFKAQKKLLVAEVKKLRTANVALKAECDGLRQQLRDLRQSVSQLRR
ncbi:unnamed protein product [Ascophyllum nodosum]